MTTGGAHERALAGARPELRTSIAGVPLAAPVVLAAGTAGTLDEMAGVMDLSSIGGLVTKSITADPREGNSPWRIIESRAAAGSGGMLNAIGLANPGIAAFEAEYLPRASELACAVIGSVAGFGIEEYAHVAGRLAGWVGRGLSAIELNVSCPNVKTGTEFGATPAAMGEVMRAVRAAVDAAAEPGEGKFNGHGRAPIFAKLSPAGGPQHVAAVARAAVEAGADGLTLCNTMPAMEVDVETGRPVLANVSGGFSGPALRPIASRIIHEAHGALPGTPIFGVGGVSSWRDAAEFVLVGASAVQVGTLSFADLRGPGRVASGLGKWVRRRGAGTVAELRGRLDG